MRTIKRLIIAIILLDNFFANLPKKVLFKTRWVLGGKCRQCGNCCKEIYIKISPRQLSSRLFTTLAIKWISWIFDFIVLRKDYDYYYLVFTCKHRRSDGKCGNYFWRPSICRNYPLVDYFKEPKVLPGCGYRPHLR
jgi:Fe-S-cluster containining protein